jgi:thymidylate kinase
MSKIFISFIGTDGSGKSTLASRIYSDLKKKNDKVKLVYGRHIPFISKYLILLVRRLYLFNESKDGYEGYADRKRGLYNKSLLLSKAYGTFLIFEYYLQLLKKVVLPYRLGYSIVSDRYVYDTIINEIAIDRRITINEIRRMINRFWVFVPKPTLTFLIQIPEDVALQRKNDIPSIGYLRTRNSLYKKIGEQENLIVLDGTLPIDLLAEMVLDKINDKEK